SRLDESSVAGHVRAMRSMVPRGGGSVWSVVEVAKLHLEHTPRWPPGITPPTAMPIDLLC
ncbi:MAG: hypothetical protein NXI02_33270, partial [Rhodobacteraceae bacterium]|nr:hypothetical protein [Paracoccaceae bacterium]